MPGMQELMEGLRAAWNSGDGQNVGRAFYLPARPDQLVAEVAAALKTGQNSEALATQVFGGGIPFAGVFEAHLNALGALGKGSWANAFGHVHDAFERFGALLKAATEPEDVEFFLPALKVLARDLTVAATKADAGVEGSKHLRKAEIALKNTFNAMMKDRSGARKPALLFVAAQLFQVYSRLNNIPFAKTLVKTLARPSTLEGVRQLKADTITYNYYCGRLFVFEDQFAEAERYLSYAFAKCHRGAVGNKRRILAYLVPVRILLGQMPTEQLLAKYQLPHFLGVCRGIRTGDLRLFESALADHQELFIRQGNFLILERTRRLCHRSLVKKVQRVAGYGPDNTRVRLGDLENAFRFLGADAEPEQVECILAGLIHRGYIKGYIAHAQRLLVLTRKGDPFPKESLRNGI
mmetsp:Transcript_36317/g.113893  ORF Transcript_36317/g.113893 Transcript_36317/m.113893 type:complete len:407 (-) Transcript_36317:62-1282(-)|eukprot:CAMPEP_0118859740 /NCGR_PEP_ID=MMETSP1163-20130328/5858_1 /TAXON_ID=124430 /ORGANISM="Phaeomonas parva, Strain CCMP2877" /LENGTH=406 /DNA_ID=CAMNT_0006793367 /DNA_START=173 /DNA_END=1393 /DNA_ORIENTATION=-